VTPLLAVSRFDVAAPFLVNVAVVVVSALASSTIITKLERAFALWREDVTTETDDEGNEKKGTETVSQPLISDPAQTAQPSIWAMDASQILGLFLGPVLGLILLAPPLTSVLGVVYIVGIVACIGTFFAFVAWVKADRYPTWGKWKLTPVTIGGIFVSLVAAGVAAAIGP
jgi:hypothetical protein